VTERVPSDHDAVAHHRVHLETVGRTSRPRVPFPAALDVAADDVVRLSLAGRDTHAQVTETLGGDLAVEGAFDNARLARTADEGENRLQAWVDEAGLGPGDPIALDVVTSGYAFGLRRPGERVVYQAREPPSDALADIARDLDG